MMTKADKKYLIAWTHAQALHFAKSMGWKRSEWSYISFPDQLKGLHSIILYDLRAPRYKPTLNEAVKMEDMQSALLIAQHSGRIAKLNVVNLP